MKYSKAAAASTPSTALSDSSQVQQAQKMQSALMKLKSEEPELYAKVFINVRLLTITVNDLITCHRLKDTKLGQVLLLDRVVEIGSKNYTLSGSPLINSSWFRVEAVVLEHGRGARVKAKVHKQRKGRRRTCTIKPHTTTLRIRRIAINV
jgi:large subunit ribosomal protein L21